MEGSNKNNKIRNMQPTTQSLINTSFHGDTIKASVNQLIELLGVPAYSHNDGEDKTNYEWEMETEEGEGFTIYDWKEYRPISRHEQIEWHIGGRCKAVTMTVKDQLTEKLAL